MFFLFQQYHAESIFSRPTQPGDPGPRDFVYGGRTYSLIPEGIRCSWTSAEKEREHRKRIKRDKWLPVKNADPLFNVNCVFEVPSNSVQLENTNQSSGEETVLNEKAAYLERLIVRAVRAALNDEFPNEQEKIKSAGLFSVALRMDEHGTFSREVHIRFSPFFDAEHPSDFAVFIFFFFIIFMFLISTI